MQVWSSIFFCFPKRKRWRVRNDHGGTSRRERRLLSSVLISSFPNRKRCAGLRFGEGISISPRTPLNRPRKPLRFSWIFPARTDRYALKFPFPASHLPLPLGEVAERSEDGEGILCPQKPSQSPAVTALPEGEPRAGGDTFFSKKIHVNSTWDSKLLFKIKAVKVR